MLARGLHPAVVGGARRHAEDAQAFFLRQVPKLCDCLEGPQPRATEAPPVGRREAGSVENFRPRRDGRFFGSPGTSHIKSSIQVRILGPNLDVSMETNSCGQLSTKCKVGGTE